MSAPDNDGDEPGVAERVAEVADLVTVALDALLPRSDGPEIGTRKSSAQVTANYTPDQLVGRRVAAVVNFPPRQIGPMRSEVLCLGFPDAAGEVVLVTVDRDAPDGGRLY